MNKRTARAIHETTNITFWLENPNWDAGNPVVNLVGRGLQALPFSVHEAQKRLFFDKEKLIAVNGETIVAANGTDKVDKFMFRYPGKLAVKSFMDQVEYEVGAVTECLAGVALETQVSIKPANIFRRSHNPFSAVTQTQTRLDLDVHSVMDLPAVADEAPSQRLDKTARDFETMLTGTERLVTDYGYYPDVAYSSGNLRRSSLDGAITLIDVMPIYADGGRLIGDRPPDLLPHTLDNLQKYQDFVGQYGS